MFGHVFGKVLLLHAARGTGAVPGFSVPCIDGYRQIFQFQAFGTVFYFHYQSCSLVIYRVAPHLFVSEVYFETENVVLYLFVADVLHFFVAFELGYPVGIACRTVNIDYYARGLYVLRYDIGKAFGKSYRDIIVFAVTPDTPRTCQRRRCESTLRHHFDTLGRYPCVRIFGQTDFIHISHFSIHLHFYTGRQVIYLSASKTVAAEAVIQISILLRAHDHRILRIEHAYFSLNLLYGSSIRSFYLQRHRRIENSVVFRHIVMTLEYSRPAACFRNRQLIEFVSAEPCYLRS